MARATKILTAVNDAVTIDDVDEINGAAAIQYGAGGVGTVVLEMTINGAEWVALKLRNPAASVNADVDNLAAAGIAWSDIIGAKSIRARKSVAGGGDVSVSLSVNNC